ARIRLLAAGTVPSRLGRLLQAAFRRTGTCAALSRRLHPSRRHFQQQVGCSLRGQRNVSLARLRPRQQEEDHDSGCRRVPAPLPAPPAATRVRTHPPLRLPRQPATRHPPAALLPTASWLGTHARSGGIAIYGPAALALELSGLRRNHARRRTALCRATPAPAPTESSCLIGPGMPAQPTSQPLPDTSARPFSARSSPANRHSCPSQRVVRYSGLDRIHSNPIDISGGGFLQVAVSEAPARDHAPATGCAAGAPDTALRLLDRFALRHPNFRVARDTARSPFLSQSAHSVPQPGHW